jgi:hypothetical protein
MNRVYDCHAGKKYPADAVYVGREVRSRRTGQIIRPATPFGNYERLTGDDFRAYAERKMQEPAFRERAMKELRGKDLLCWCVQEGPKRAEFCHARVWVELVNA